jgi:flagellar biosynthesis/type III secretory pathway protein FliH
LTIFKEGVDVMLTRLQEYRDRRKNKIAKEVEKQVEKRVVEAKKEGYQEGYKAAKSESGSHGK